MSQQYQSFRVRVPLWIGLVITVAGCGAKDYAPVSGIVTIGGEPVANATVTFASKEGIARGLFSTGVTDSQGRYSLITQGSERFNGARVGMNQVTIAALEVEKMVLGDRTDSNGSIAMLGARPPRVRSLLPVKYQDFDQSGLRFDVPVGGSSEANFSLDEE